VTGSVPRGDLNGAALLSNGASRIVDPYRLAEWPTVLDLLRTTGPNALLQWVREAETRDGSDGSLPGFRTPDDATVAYCEPSTMGEPGVGQDQTSCFERSPGWSDAVRIDPPFR
jgi:hypothetical protein